MEQKLSIVNNDCICAVATPYGRGGISVIRLSGKNVLETVGKIWRGKSFSDIEPNTCRVGYIYDENGDELDQAVITFFKAPHSFTGEDVVELSIHGSPWIAKRTTEALIHAGARVANRGEFTQRAFLNGKIDLAQAESIADMIATSSKAAHRLAMQQLSGSYSNKISALRQQLVDFASMLELELDFSEEDVEFADRSRLLQLAKECKILVDKLANSYQKGRVFKEGIPTIIAGNPNAGKSTLLNALIEEDKAIVTDIPGTTRDAIEATSEINDLLFRFYDTAGIRKSSDPIEQIGVQRSLQLLSEASIIVWVIDSSLPINEIREQIDTLAAQLHTIRTHTDLIPKLVIAFNKTDLRADNGDAYEEDCHSLFMPLEDVYKVGDNLIISKISAKAEEGLIDLKGALICLAGNLPGDDDEIIVTNSRHYQLLRQASEAITQAIAGIETGLSADFIAQDVRETLHHLSEITGTITSTHLLHTIFSRFCIGK